MSLFNVRKGSKRNIRKKIVSTEDEEEENEPKDSLGDSSSVPQHVTTSNAKAPLRSSTSGSANRSGAGVSVLSFAAEEEDSGETFTLKKKRDHEKRLAKMVAKEQKEKKKREKDLVNSATTMRSKSAPSKAPRPVTPPDDGEEESEDEDGRILAGDEATSKQIEGQSSALLQRLGPGLIPDSATIHAVKKHRELMRQVGQNYVQADPTTTPPRGYLPLDTTRKVDTSESRSRLVREDDNDRSDDEDNTNIQQAVMNFGTNKGPTRQERVITALENVGGSDEEDEEMQRWEEAQINKGVKITLPVKQDTDPFHPHPQQQYGYQSVDTYTAHPRRPLLPPHQMVPVTTESLKHRLQNHLEGMKEAHSSHKSSLEQASDDLEVYKSDIAHFDETVQNLASSYKFYQEMKVYLSNLLGCLAEKSPETDSLEDRVIEVWKSKAERLVTRRQHDVQDLMEECSRIDGRNVPSQVAELDSFGHDVGELKEEARRRRMADRAGRHRRRREKRGVGPPEPEGMSTDDEEMEGDRQRTTLELDNLQSVADEVFEDVVEEFSTLPAIRQHFEQWKSSYPDSYNQAFISLCLPKVVAPFARLQMLMWNPLQTNCTALEDFHWFREFLFYACRRGQELAESDEDNLLLASVVEKVVLPKLAALAEKVWDPLSATQTKRLVSYITNFQRDFPTITPLSKALQAVCTAVTTRMRRCLDTDIYIPLYSKQQLETPSSLHLQFYQCQFWKAVKLFSNILLWQGVLPGGDPSIVGLAVDGLLNRYLLLALQNLPPSPKTVDKVAAIVSSMPTSWLAAPNIRSQVQGLTRYIVHLTDALDQATIGFPDFERRKTRSAMLQLHGLLVKLKATEEAETLSLKYIHVQPQAP